MANYAVTPTYNYTNINTDTTTTIKSSSGNLHSIVVNTVAATGTIQIYDNTAASGTKIGLITAASAGTYLYNVDFNTGLTIVTATAAPDITVCWR